MTITWIFVASLLAVSASAGEATADTAQRGVPVTPPTPADQPEPAGPCPVGPSNSCVLDLKGTKAPEVPGACVTAPWSSYLTFEQPSKLSNANGDLWWESVVKINLDPAGGCGCAVFAVTYDERPTGFTVDIGDSPTNDGWGGDSGTTQWSAEANIEKQSLSVYSDSSGMRVDKLLAMRLPDLAGRTVL